jgi:hypothetical protein
MVTMTDEKQIEMLIDSLIDIYRILKQTADEYSDLFHGRNSSNEEISKAEKTLIEVKSVYEKACNTIGFTLSELKNNGYVFKIKAVQVKGNI